MGLHDLRGAPCIIPVARSSPMEVLRNTKAPPTWNRQGFGFSELRGPAFRTATDHVPRAGEFITRLRDGSRSSAEAGRLNTGLCQQFSLRRVAPAYVAQRAVEAPSRPRRTPQPEGNQVRMRLRDQPLSEVQGSVALGLCPGLPKVGRPRVQVPAISVSPCLCPSSTGRGTGFERDP